MFLEEPTGTAPNLASLFPMFAHQGGWDEVLLVAVPLSIIGGLLWLANRRVNAQLEEATRNTESADTSHDPQDSASQ